MFSVARGFGVGDFGERCEERGEVGATTAVGRGGGGAGVCGIVFDCGFLLGLREMGEGCWVWACLRKWTYWWLRCVARGGVRCWVFGGWVLLGLRSCLCIE